MVAAIISQGLGPCSWLDEPGRGIGCLIFHRDKATLETEPLTVLAHAPSWLLLTSVCGDIPLPRLNVCVICLFLFTSMFELARMDMIILMLSWPFHETTYDRRTRGLNRFRYIS